MFVIGEILNYGNYCLFDLDNLIFVSSIISDDFPFVVVFFFFNLIFNFDSDVYALGLLIHICR